MLVLFLVEITTITLIKLFNLVIFGFFSIEVLFTVLYKHVHYLSATLVYGHITLSTSRPIWKFSNVERG